MTEQIINTEFQKYKFDQTYRLITGLILISITLLLLSPLVFLDLPLQVSQGLMALATLILLVALDVFKQCLQRIDQDDDRQINVVDQRSYSTKNYITYNIQNIAQTAQDIQILLEQLSQNHSLETAQDKANIVTKAMAKIEADSSFRNRVDSALKSGGTAALEPLINHPTAKVLLAFLEGWQELE
jgi:hypothetical protein